MHNFYDSKGYFSPCSFPLLNGCSRCLYNLNPRHSETTLWIKPSFCHYLKSRESYHVKTLSPCHCYQALEFFTPIPNLQSPLLIFSDSSLNFSMSLELQAAVNKLPHTLHHFSWNVCSLLWVRAAPCLQPSQMGTDFQATHLHPWNSNPCFWHSSSPLFPSTHLSTLGCR